MRIVHVAGFYGPGSGGIRTSMRALGAGYLRAGHEFTVIGPGRGSLREETEYGTRITVPRIPLAGSGHSLIAIEFGVRRALAECAPDRIEVSDRLTLRRLGVWATRRGIPAVMFSHQKPNDWILKMATPREPVGLRADAADLRNYSRIVCTTAAAAAQFEALMPGRVAQVGLGVDLETFSPLRWSAEIRRSFLAGTGVLLTHVGRLSPEKAPQRSIDTLRELRARGVDARLVIAGTGPLRPWLERSAAGLPVEFVGQVDDRRTLAALLASSDVALNPGPIETFCLSALEALASGTPVVADSRSSIGELVGDGGGVGVGELSAPTGAAFADAVQRILGRPVENRRTEARAQAAKFPWRRTVDAMLAVHESLGAPPRQARESLTERDPTVKPTPL
jgi:alpha-1,6-mannosyltransferase